MEETMAATQDKKPIVYKSYDDGYIVRQMLPEDAKIVQGWFSAMASLSRADLDITLSVFPPNSQGFYIGEYEGAVVASALRIPWGDVFYGSYYYVDEKYRAKGFGTRLRDQVAREYVGKNICCIDAVLGSVTEKNLARYGYILGFKTGNFCTTAKKNVAQYSGEIKKATDVPFDDLCAYDNKNFVCANNRERREFLRKWIAIPDGAAFVALNKSGQIVGLGCRRACIQEKAHNIGPLYADNLEIANGLMQQLLDDIVEHKVAVNVCYTNSDALKMIEKFDFQKYMELQRMYLNADPGVPKNTLFGLTSIDVCGY